MKFTEKQRKQIRRIIESIYLNVCQDSMIDEIQSVLSSLPTPTQDGTAEEVGEKNKVFYSALKYTHDLPIRNMKLFKSLAFEMMSDFAAPIRAEIEEKNKRISEQAEKLRFSHDRIGELKSELAASQQRVAELEEAIKWALGENGEFVGREVGQGAFWWRTELRRRSKF